MASKHHGDTQVYKWNTRDLLLKTPLFSTTVENGDVERNIVAEMVRLELQF